MQTHHVLFVILIMLLLLCGCITDKNGIEPETNNSEDPTTILTNLNNLLTLDPKNPDLWYVKAKELYENGDVDGALDAITKAAEYNPRNGTILLTKSQILITAGERERAGRELLKVLDLLPGNETALNLLSSLRVNTTKPLTYIQVEHDLLIEPNNTWSAFNKGRLLFEEGRHSEALPWFIKATTYDPDNAPAWYFTGTTYTELGRYAPAIDALQKALVLDPSNAGTYSEMGRASEKLGNLTAARMHYETAIKLNPDNEWTRFVYGKNLAISGDYESAINELKTSLEKSSCKAPVWYELANVYYNTMQYDLALEAINSALTIDPYTKEYRTLYLSIRAAQDPASWSLANVSNKTADAPKNASLWFYQGAIAYHDRRYADALNYLNSAVKFDPINPEAWYYRGMAQYELGKYQDALCSFDKTILLDPGNAWAYYYRGDILQKGGQCEYAIAYLNKGIQLDPSIPWTYYTKGNCYLNQSRYQLAADEFDKSIDLFPCNRWAWFFGGQSYYELGKFPIAHEYFTKALSFDPENEEFRRWKARAAAESLLPDEAIYLYNQTLPFSTDACGII